MVAEGVDDEGADAAEGLEGGGGDLFAVGEVGDAGKAWAIEAKAGGDDFAVLRWQGGDGGGAEEEGADNFVGVWLEVSGELILAIEGEGEGVLEAEHRFWGGVDGDASVGAKGEGAEVVEAHDVVGVGVGDKDGVEVRDVVAEALAAEIGAGVDDPGELWGAQEDGGAVALVAGVWGAADGAGAADHGDAEGGAGAEKSEFEGCHGRWW